MKHFARLFLLLLALAVGGGLGWLLLPEFEPLKMLAFGALCMALGEVFFRLDGWIAARAATKE